MKREVFLFKIIYPIFIIYFRKYLNIQIFISKMFKLLIEKSLVLKKKNSDRLPNNTFVGGAPRQCAEGNPGGFEKEFVCGIF